MSPPQRPVVTPGRSLSAPGCDAAPPGHSQALSGFYRPFSGIPRLSQEIALPHRWQTGGKDQGLRGDLPVYQRCDHGQNYGLPEHRHAIPSAAWEDPFLEHPSVVPPTSGMLTWCSKEVLRWRRPAGMITVPN